MKEKFELIPMGEYSHLIRKIKRHWWSKWEIEMDGNTPKIYPIDQEHCEHEFSNLDEAAEEYATTYFKDGRHIIDADRMFGFKAGAEWMARQGFSFSGEVNDDEFVDTDKGILHSKEMPFKNGDKVIVQIRKK